ncbi:unnamed protein product [Pedinophyceae sp. YPF-701]|nr:unnamed protein product [Pedinophyceae sp. YPF-701]
MSPPRGGARTQAGESAGGRPADMAAEAPRQHHAGEVEPEAGGAGGTLPKRRRIGTRKATADAQNDAFEGGAAPARREPENEAVAALYDLAQIAASGAAINTPVKEPKGRRGRGTKATAGASASQRAGASVPVSAIGHPVGVPALPGAGVPPGPLTYLAAPGNVVLAPMALLPAPPATENSAAKRHVYIAKFIASRSHSGPGAAHMASVLGGGAGSVPPAPLLLPANAPGAPATAAALDAKSASLPAPSIAVPARAGVDAPVAGDTPTAAVGAGGGKGGGGGKGAAGCAARE